MQLKVESNGTSVHTTLAIFNKDSIIYVLKNMHQDAQIVVVFFSSSCFQPLGYEKRIVVLTLLQQCWLAHERDEKRKKMSISKRGKRTLQC